MVRHKVRWLLVQFDFEKKLEEKENYYDDEDSDSDAVATRSILSFPSKKEISAMIRQSMSSCFGLVADGAANEVQIRLVDPSTRLVLLRTPRKLCNLVRCSLTLLTTATITRDGNNATGEANNKNNRPIRIVASVISVNGSARTAKLATMGRVKEYYKKKMLSNKDDNEKDGKTTMKKKKDQQHEALVKELQALLTTIQNID